MTESLRNALVWAFAAGVATHWRFWPVVVFSLCLFTLHGASHLIVLAIAAKRG